MIVLGAEPLDLDGYRAVAAGEERITLDPRALRVVASRRELMLADVAAGVPAYGVSTGVGRMAGVAIPAAEQEAFQQALLVRGVGQGPPLPAAVVRGAMVVRLLGFLGGVAGVSVGLCEYLAARLNEGFIPWVPSHATTSAGEVVPLSHLFQPLVGAGWVLEDGRRVPAAEALAARGVEPYALGLKEGIALVNGAPLAPTVAADAAARARGLLAVATLAGALAVAVTGGSLRPFSPRLAALARDPDQETIAREVVAWHAGGADWADRPQAPVSHRVLVPVHAAARDVLDRIEARMTTSLGAVTDSPLYLGADGDEPSGFYPSGGFHAAAYALELDALAAAAAQVAGLSEKRLHRLLEARFSGLPDQLVGGGPASGGLAFRHKARPPRGGGPASGGLAFLHKAVLGPVAECRALAAPASVAMADDSTGQEDVQSMALLGAERLHRLLSELELILACELVALRQARHLRDRVLPPRLEAVVAALAAAVEPVTVQRDLSGDVERVRALLAGGTLSPPA